MSKKKATVTNPTRVTTPVKSAPVTATAKTGDAPQNWLLNALAALLLIAYGYVTVITPNWMAFDSNATKFYTFAILNLIVVALVFLIKEFRDRTQVLFGFFSNKIGIAYCVIMVFALLSFSKAIDVEEAILHYSKIFIVFTAAWMVSALVIFNKKNLVPLAVAMTLLLLYDFVITIQGVKGIIKGLDTSFSYNIKGGYSNKNILASAMFIKLPFAIWLFYFRKEMWQRTLGAAGILGGTMAIFFMSTRSFYLATIITIIIFIVYGAIDFFVFKRREIGKKVLMHLAIALVAFGIFSFVQNFLYPQELRESTNFGARLATVASEENSSNNLRKTAWLVTATDMIPNDPILGVGIGNWKVRFLQYENSYSPHYIYMYKNHNDFLELTAEAGIFAGLAFVAIFLLAAYYFLWSTYRRKDSKQEYWFFLPLFGLFAYSFDAFFNFPQDRPEIQALFSIFVGIAVGLGVIYYRKKREEASESAPKQLPLMAVGFIGLIALATAAINVVVERMYFDSSKMQRMIKEEQSNVRPTKSTGEFLIRNYPRVPNLTAVAEPVDVEKARYLIDEQKFDQARKVLQTINYHPYDARPEYFMAVSYFMEPEKNNDSIYKYAHKARMIKPNFFGALNLETFALNNMGKEQESIHLLKQYLGLEKDSTAVIPKWKQTLKKFRIDVDEAAMYYKRTNEPQAWNALAYLQEKNGMIADAKATIDSAFVYIPDNADIVNNRNKLTSRVQVEQFMPLYAEAVNYYNTQRFDEAAKVFSAFLEKVPAHIEAYRLRAFCYYNLGQYQKVIADINQIEALGVVVDPVLNNYRGSCYYMLGNKANAKVYFEKAANEGNADAKKNLSTLSF